MISSDDDNSEHININIHPLDEFMSAELDNLLDVYDALVDKYPYVFTMRSTFLTDLVLVHAGIWSSPTSYSRKLAFKTRASHRAFRKFLTEYEDVLQDSHEIMSNYMYHLKAQIQFKTWCMFCFVHSLN